MKCLTPLLILLDKHGNGTLLTFFLISYIFPESAAASLHSMHIFSTIIMNKNGAAIFLG